MRGWLTADRVPLVAFVAVILVGWAGAAYYIPHIPPGQQTPFTPVWASYETRRAAELVSWCLLGVLGAMWMPLGPGMTLGAMGASIAESLGRFRALWLLVAVGGLALLVLVKGPLLLYAPQYLAFVAPNALVSLANVVAPVAVLATGVTSTRRPLLGWVLMLAILVVLFAYATRVFAGVAALFLIGRLLGGRKVGVIGVSAVLAFTLFALPIPLMNRMQPQHGLIPYAADTWTFVTGGTFVQEALRVGAENVGFSVPLLIDVADHMHFPASNLLMEINPLPAGMVGWDVVAPSMRVHYYIPYSMLGELANVGGPVLALGVMVWGTVMRFAVRSVAREDNPLMSFFVAGQLGLALISVVYAAQYNTRSVARLVWIMLALVVLEALTRRALAFWNDYRFSRATAPTPGSGTGWPARTPGTSAGTLASESDGAATG